MNTSRSFRARARSVHAVMLLSGLLLAGCPSEGEDGANRTHDLCSALSGLAIPGRGTAASHGDPQRHDSEVEVLHDGRHYVARQAVSLTNDRGGAQAVQLSLRTQNGQVVHCLRDEGGYGTRVLLEGRGRSEAEARQALESMTVLHTDEMAGAELLVATVVEFDAVSHRLPPLLEDPLGGLNTSAPQRSATIVMGVPTEPSYSLRHGATNGDIAVPPLRGALAALDTTNGNIVLSGRWDEANLDTTNGLIEVAGDYAELNADTTNGAIAAWLETRRSAEIRLDNTNGGIEVKLRRSGAAAFDLQGEASNGHVSIEVRGTRPVEPPSENEKHYSSPGYGSAQVQFAVSASTTNGNIRIRD